ncbi:Replicative DNA helicase [hydrothermal vent metagenome]
MIAKHRNGETGNIKLAWIGQYTRFENLANDSQAQYAPEDWQIEATDMHNAPSFEDDGAPHFETEAF